MSRHLETCGCPVCQGVSPALRMNPLADSEIAMLKNSVPPLELRPAPKRLLIVYDQNVFNTNHIHALCNMLMANGLHTWAIPIYMSEGEDFRIFNLDGLPAPDTGLVQRLIAGIAAKDGKVWTPGGEFIPLEDACPECEGAGQVTTDRATCLSCAGTGRKKEAECSGAVAIAESELRKKQVDTAG